MAGAVANSRTRVEERTLESQNQMIDTATRRKLEYYSHHPEDIRGRLGQLDLEWDIERALETNASVIALTSLLFGYKVFAMIVLAFLLEHAIQGWCPPMILFRQLGVRTQTEINNERFALKVLRGDFEDFTAKDSPSSGGGVTAKFDPSEVLDKTKMNQPQT